MYNLLSADPSISPEREIWDAIGSFRYPDRLVNAQETLNGFKACIVCGFNGIGIRRWRDNGWDITSEQHGITLTQEALSELCLFPAVFAYLNAARVHGNLVAITNDHDSIFARL